MHAVKDQRSKLDSKSKPCIFMGYSEDEFGYRLWDLVDKKVVRSQDIVFMEDETIQDWKQQESKLVSQSTPLTIPVDHTWSTERRQSFGTAESEIIDLGLSRNVDKSELANPEQTNDMYEFEPNEVSTGTFEPEPTIGGRRYPLKERRAPTTHVSQYILMTDEGDPECYDETIADKHKEKWLSTMQYEMDSFGLLA